MVGLRRDGQLQYRSALPGDQPSELQNLPVWEFQRIVVEVRIVHLDLAKTRNLVLDTARAKKAEGAVVPDLVVEGQFRSGQETDRHVGWWAVMNYELGTELPDGSKAASAGSPKFHRNQLVADLGIIRNRFASPSRPFSS
jgi:hypothetical protein